MRKSLLMTFLLLTLILGACGGASLEGEEVTITGALIGEDQEGFRANFESFTEETGIVVTYQGSDNFEQEIQIQMESGDTPDFALWPQPGAVVDAAQRGMLTSLADLDIDLDAYATNFSSYLVGLGTVDDVVYGGANAANLKSIVWYQPAEFEARGYAVPETWDAMIALADQIVADGMNPFCFGMYSNGASGWLATDWMEDIMLRTGNGTASYDQWVTNELKFEDPIVKNAATLLSQIMHTENYVVGGTDAIVSTYFGNAQDPMFSKDANGNPGCFMHRQASFIPSFWPEANQAEAGIETTVFPFPVIDASLPKAALGAGDMWGAFNDRDATKAVAEYMLSAEFHAAAAAMPNNARLSAHTGFDTSLYSKDINRILGTIIADALAADAFRFDASDLMPPEVGAGSFWKEMMNLAVEGPGYIDTALANIDTSWP
ncbi:ABC transporter substrate-binding protein [Candidatus Actinomarina sp.]|jgi:alpha-glucoside transport system substrate-binding protein|nr:ABC transporter substrate-binding protein [bacterium]MDA8653179.1 ABC transporter substrate-binding protein [Candidatus Actinomarina sp.]MDA9197767.1 ABC transporter substrate-binding protein [Acidimicrobiia bacterium]MDB2532762.1 ABC transporter substrate-binding protein [Candidatus Actinomarina sp.]MDB3891401.1 ABC transporter substrate-binding protein [Acidimicrobiia bacterium]